MRVVVLGCGPAGLLAAHAATINGYDPVIISKKHKSPIGGAQFLHAEIPELKVTCSRVIMNFLGDRETYALKVYGNEAAPTSWKRFEQTGRIWSMREAYDKLWDRYEHLIYDEEVTPDQIATEMVEKALVLSAIPAIALCMKPEEHVFKSQAVWLTYRYVADLWQNFVTYNGTEIDQWYRYSQLFGWESYEFSRSPEPPEVQGIGNIVNVNKPVSTNCDCFQYSPLAKLGRYGKWDKWQLSHDAFFDAQKALIWGKELGL